MKDDQMVWRQILNEFKSGARQIGEKQGFSCEPWLKDTDIQLLKPHMGPVSENIVEFSGSINCLVYIKVRTGEPLAWGITANQMSKLDQSGKDWVVVLLYKTAHTGFLLTASDVNRGSSTWTIKKGDYRVYPGNIEVCRVFESFRGFIDRLHQTLQYK
ncbi:MAG: hypothetical protein GWP10_19085 [Nitrospiraceae bacterium]|nr:hypothetical protein [Nitrospiraceae bacterium]